MIHPHLSYGVLAWGNAAQKYLNCTTILQKRAIRIIHQATYNAHTEPLFKKANVLKLVDLYEYEAAQFMFKYIPKNFLCLSVECFGIIIMYKSPTKLDNHT